MAEENTPEVYTDDEYANLLVHMIRDDLPIMAKYNPHFYLIIKSTIELMIDKSIAYYQNEGAPLKEETREEVNRIIDEILNEEDS